jgi:hypothetical protein
MAVVSGRIPVACLATACAIGTVASAASVASADDAEGSSQPAPAEGTEFSSRSSDVSFTALKQTDQIAFVQST